MKINNTVVGNNSSINSSSFNGRVSKHKGTTVIKSRKSALRKSLAIHRLKSLKQQVSTNQELELISLFSQELITVCQRLTFPFLYNCIELFFAPCIDVEEIKNIREDIIVIITKNLITG
jgi:hypothetical protein